MKGSVAATFVLLFAGTAAAAILWAVHHVNRHSHQVADTEQLRTDLVESNTDRARLEGENTRLRAELLTVKDLATGRQDIRDLMQEIRALVWVLAGPNEEQGRGQRPRQPRQQDGE